jgi:hypothetical protein
MIEEHDLKWLFLPPIDAGVLSYKLINTMKGSCRIIIQNKTIKYFIKI